MDKPQAKNDICWYLLYAMSQPNTVTRPQHQESHQPSSRSDRPTITRSERQTEEWVAMQALHPVQRPERVAVSNDARSPADDSFVAPSGPQRRLRREVAPNTEADQHSGSNQHSLDPRSGVPSANNTPSPSYARNSYQQQNTALMRETQADVAMYWIMPVRQDAMPQLCRIVAEPEVLRLVEEGDSPMVRDKGPAKIQESDDLHAIATPTRESIGMD
ncbi:MAG: hypothetical protein Q9218_004170 [Villophora microphyllina]